MKNGRLKFAAVSVFAILLAWGGGKFFAQLGLRKATAQNPIQLTIAEAFINAFYSWQAEPLYYLLSDTLSRDNVLYYQAWAEAGNYQIQNRLPCYNAANGSVYCAITVSDDLGGNLGYVATDTFRLDFSQDRITQVEFSGDDPMIFNFLLLSIALNQPEVFDGPCDKMFDGGTTPKQCVKAIVAAAKEF